MRLRSASTLRSLHALLVVRRLEGDVAVEQHHGAHVLHADVGHVAVVDGIRALVRDRTTSFSTSAALMLVLADQLEQPVERRLDRRAHRPALDVGVHDFVDLRRGRCTRQLRLRRFADAARLVVGDEEIALAGEHVLDRR